MTKGLRWLFVGLIACSGTEGNDASAKQPRHAEPAASAPAASATGAASCPGELPQVVAEVGGVPITRDELFAEAGSELIGAEVALAEARKGALENLVLQRLAEAEAKKQNLAPEEWFSKELAAASTPVSDEEIASFYRENANQMQGATLDQARPQIEQYLQQRKDAEAVGTLAERLKKEAGVKLFLEPYRVNVEAKDSPRTGGKADAPVQIVEFSDFQCPYCSMAAETVHKVGEKYGDKVSIVYRHFPLPNHGAAHRAAEASQCANDQGQFWKYHDQLFADQKAWTDDDHRKYAKDLGLDDKAFAKCLESGVHAATVQEDMADGKKVGMGGTPGFYINGVVLNGAQPFETFVEVIDAELARANGG